MTWLYSALLWAGIIAFFVIRRKLKKAGVLPSQQAVPAGKVVVRRVPYDAVAAKEIEKYQRQGYELTSHNTRKAAWSPLTGLFTSKQIHTLTFTKQ